MKWCLLLPFEDQKLRVVGSWAGTTGELSLQMTNILITMANPVWALPNSHGPCRETGISKFL